MKKMLKLIVFFLVILLSGCIFFESIDQPASALPDEIIIVSIDVTTEGGDEQPYFGVCLPNGWTIPGDSFPCTGVYNETIYYDSLVSFEQESASPAPEGYYWWAGAGAAVATDSGSVYGQFEIQTDSQVGFFSIDYMLGDSSTGGLEGREVNQERSNNHLIEIVYDEYTPRGLQAIVEGTSVVLNWGEPFNTEGLLGYNIYRDEQQLNQTLIVDTTYTDEAPLNGVHYYAVSSLYDDGSEHLIPYEILVIFGDLYVSPDGNNSNNGSSFEDALFTISYALSIITPDSLNPKSIFLAPGVYSPYTNGEIFPLEWINYVSLDGILEEETILDADSLTQIITFNDITNANIENVTIRNGFTAGYGGGINCWYSSPSFKNVTITDNFAVWGSGIYIYCYSNPKLENVTIINNEASHGGGGIYCGWYSNPVLLNVEILNNSGGYRGGGISCVHHSNPILHNVTITGNYAAYSSGGIRCDYHCNLNLVNCILWNNSPNEISIIASSSVNATYSDIQGGWEGEGNIDEDPLFVGTGEDPYSLLEDSPCIDAGDPDTLGLNLPPWDIIGNLRIWDGDGDEVAIIDMGAYEYGAPPYVDIDDNVIVQTPEIFLHQNYPNPFNPTTTINYSLKENSKVSLNIYNIKGQKVKTLVNELLLSGKHSIIWNGRDSNGNRVGSGIYFYKLKTDNFEKTRKMILLR
jgi:predicted outer membrane repeat protein